MPNETDLVNVKLFGHNTSETFVSFDLPELLDPSSTPRPDNDHERIILDIYIWGFLASFGLIGLFFNVLTIHTLFRAKCNGTRYFLLQLSFCDFGTLLICGLELFYINYRRWLPPPELCPVYLGMESFTSTATIYFIVAINLHSISTYNLAIKTLKKESSLESVYAELSPDQDNNQQQPPDGGYEHPLQNYEVALQKRYLTIDYSKRKSGISVILPALFIWFVAASVSIPLFVFGNVIPNEFNPMICGVVNFDNHNNRLMQILVLIIRIAIPTICLHISSIYVLVKLFLAKAKIQPCGLDENVSSILKLGLLLSISFMFLSMQKIFGSLLFEVISKPFLHYKYPHMGQLAGLAFSMLSFLLPSIRPIMYFAIDNNLRDIFWKCRRKSTHQPVAVEETT